MPVCVLYVDMMCVCIYLDCFFGFCLCWYVSVCLFVVNVHYKVLYAYMMYVYEIYIYLFGWFNMMQIRETIAVAC